MTPEKRERAVKWLTEEVRSLRLAPKINGCGPENWQDQLEIMETCLEAVRECDQNATEMRPGCNLGEPLTLEQLREMERDILALTMTAARYSYSAKATRLSRWGTWKSLMLLWQHYEG